MFPTNSKPDVFFFREGNTRTLNEKHIAGEVMFEFVDMMVCHADSFSMVTLSQLYPWTSCLMPGQTYFSSPKLSPINFGARPFEYIKDANSKVLIKVVPKFIISFIVKIK
ncbi:hypothetical protein V6Z11_D11G178400 [Gossypium hirsutum]